jgi:hypothetical protein
MLYRESVRSVPAGAADTRWERREGVAQDDGVECSRIHEHDIWLLSFSVTAEVCSKPWPVYFLDMARRMS